VLKRVSWAALQPILGKAALDIVDRLANPCLVVDRELRVVSNAAFGELFGIAPPAARAARVFDVGAGLLDRPEVRALVADDGSWREVQHLPLDLAVAGLGRRVVALTVVRITANRFNTGLTLLAFQDDTARSLMAEERARMAAAFDQATNLIAMTDETGRLTYANPAFARLAELPESDLIGLEVGLVLNGQLGRAGPKRVQSLWSDEGWSGPMAVARPDGTKVALAIVTAPVVTGAAVVGHVFIGRDVTAQRRAEAELRRQVRERAAVARALHRIRPGSEPEETAAALCREIRRRPGFDGARVLAFWGPTATTPLATWGIDGDVQPGRHVLRKLSAYLEQQVGGGPWIETCRGEQASLYGNFWATAGMGAVASVPIAGPDGPLGVLAVGTAHADPAELERQLPTILEFGAIATALLAGPLTEERAVLRRKAEIWSTISGRRFDPVFQPIVELRSERIVGFEALTRFHDGGNPAERFALARAAGLGPIFEEACLREALHDARGLPDDAWLSLNISATCMADASRLRELLADDGRGIVLEITEHEEDADAVAIRDAVVRLGDRVRTIRLAVDDAGAGFNGLQFILGLAPDLIKLDQSLIIGVETDPARQALVAGMRHFADEIGADLVAEGIETGAALEELLSLGVAYGQGFFLGAPAPIAAWRADGRLAVAAIGAPARVSG
jgi:PAS domain S-box-containing protein